MNSLDYQEKAQEIEMPRLGDCSHTTSDDTPGNHDAGNPKRRIDACHNQIRRDLKHLSNHNM